mmetsp:Transcript_18570/g.38633  ORF Transcript_18570/g.38633 Transcript_18570/m.38633 type:complete len:92 (+) Transcript_18570:103-378(+)
MDVNDKRAINQAMKDEELARKQNDKDCVSKAHKDKSAKGASGADEIVSQDEVQAARDAKKKEQEKAACDYAAIEALEAEAARAAAAVPPPS